MDQHTQKLLGVVARRRGGVSEPTEGGTWAKGAVWDVTAGGLRFTIDAFDGGKRLFGPAPWPDPKVQTVDAHTHPATVPARGDRCLVLFVGAGHDSPWVLSWWPGAWPAVR